MAAATIAEIFFCFTRHRVSKASRRLRDYHQHHHICITIGCYHKRCRRHWKAHRQAHQFQRITWTRPSPTRRLSSAASSTCSACLGPSPSRGLCWPDWCWWPDHEWCVYCDWLWLRRRSEHDAGSGYGCVVSLNYINLNRMFFFSLKNIDWTGP